MIYLLTYLGIVAADSAAAKLGADPLWALDNFRVNQFLVSSSADSAFECCCCWC